MLVCFPRWATEGWAGFAPERERQTALPATSPEAPSLPGAALQAGTTTGKLQNRQESDCTEHSSSPHRSSTHFIYSHRTCFQTARREEAEASDGSSLHHAVLGLKPPKQRPSPVSWSHSATLLNCTSAAYNEKPERLKNTIDQKSQMDKGATFMPLRNLFYVYSVKSVLQFSLKHTYIEILPIQLNIF